MSLEDLQAKQRDFEKWNRLAKELQSACEAGLKRVTNEASRLSGLKLSYRQDRLPYVRANSSGCSVGGDTCLHVSAVGVFSSVKLSTIDCSISAARDGGYAYRFSSRIEDRKFGLNVTLDTLAVPIVVRYGSWTCNLWWRGPADDTKLAAAVVDCMAKNERASEFALKPVRPPVSWAQYGCILILLAFVLLYLATLWLR